MKKIVLSTVLALCMLAVLLSTVAVAGGTTWDGTIPSANPSCAFSGGDGKSASPYIISTAADLAQLSANVESGMNYKDMHFKMQNDIALNSGSSSYPWDPIGSYEQLTEGNISYVWDIPRQCYLPGVINDPSRPFSGTFDGGGYTVSGLYINTTKSIQGLFAYNTGTIENLTVAGDITAGQNVGGVTGRNEGTISNCKNAVNVITADTFIGGVSGDNAGTIENCGNTGSIFNGGGIVGWNAGKVNRCNNSGSITGRSGGGLVDTNYNGGSVTNCYNTGSINVNGYGGGVVGENNAFDKTCTVAYCFNLGTVTGGQVGGVVGYNHNDEDGTNKAVTNVQSCYNAGIVTTKENYGYNAGGVIGHSLVSSGTSNVQNCFNTGFVTTERYGNDSAGGVIGTSSGAGTSTIQNCYYDKQMCPTKGIASGSASGSPVGKLTTEMLGTLLSSSLGSANNWVFTSGLYPRLANMATSAAANVAAAPVSFDSSDTAAKVTKNFSVGTENGVSWSSNKAELVKISGNNATILKDTGTGETVTLTALLNGVSKAIIIASVDAPNYSTFTMKEPKMYSANYGYEQTNFTTGAIFFAASGATDITIRSVELSGQNPSSFVLCDKTGITTIPAGYMDIYYCNIQPLTGLLPGIYKATIIVTYDNQALVNQQLTVDVSFGVGNASQLAPAAPTLYAGNDTSITLNTMSGAEYRRDGTNWQDSTTFSDLESNTSYTFYARMAAKTNYDASATSSGTAIVTLPEVLKNFTVTWIVDGKTTTKTYDNGQTPTFSGSTTKAPDAQYTYTFTGWDKTLSAVTVDVTYTAQYAKTAHGLPAAYFKAYIPTWSETGSVDVVDLIHNTIEKAKFNVGKFPSGAAINQNGQVFIPLYHAPLSLIDSATDTVTKTIPAGPDGVCSPMSVAFNQDGSLAYVLDYIYGISVIDTTSLTEITDKKITNKVSGSYVSSILRVGNFLYVHGSAYDDNQVKVIDLSDNKLKASIVVGFGPAGGAANPSGTKIYIANKKDSTVSVIDVASNTVTATIPVGSGPSAIEVTPDGKYIYVACSGTNNVEVVDATTNEVMNRISVGEYPNAIGISQDGNYAYCVNGDISWKPDSHSLSIISTEAKAVISTLDTSIGPAARGGIFMATTYAVAESKIRNAGNVNNAIAGAKTALDEADLSYASGENKDTVMSNITAPLIGENGTTISWAENSDKGNNIVVSGNSITVTRPSSAEGDKTVVITATIAKAGGTSQTKDLTFTIKAVMAVRVSEVTLNESTLNLTAGGSTGTLTATVAPENATNKRINWGSSDSKVAIVENGVVTPVAAGTATITVTTEDGSKTRTCTVTVKAATISVSGVSLNKDTLSLTAGGTTGILAASVTPSDASNQAVNWGSSDSKVATVENGVVTPVAAGTATITVTTEDGSKTRTCIVTVKAATISVGEVSLNESTLSLTAGGTTGILTASVTPENATNKRINWGSSDSKVATVENGVVTPVAAGTATITVTTEDGSKIRTCTVTVKAATISVGEVSLNESTLSLTAGGTTGTLTASVVPDNASNKKVSWSSSDESVATVANGVVTPKAAGTTIITVTTEDGSKTAICTVTVKIYTVSIGTLTGGSISASPTSAASGTTINLTITPENGKQLKTGTLKYNDGTQDHVINGTSFSMPAANVTLIAEFEAATQVIVDTGGKSGQAQLPEGTNDLQLGENIVLNLSSGLQTAVEGNITVGGQSQSMNPYNGGDLVAVNLTVPQNVGGQPVQLTKAVRLESGTDNHPITITNTGMARVSASIPDGTTILAPDGWNGSITPPRQGSNAGTAPSGFSVGNTVIEVGASNDILLFDKPVTLTLQGVTGPVGYRPAGSTTWVQITQQAGGNYASPTSPAFPGEAYICNGTDTKIITYHMTAFAGLVAIPPDPYVPPYTPSWYSVNGVNLDKSTLSLTVNEAPCTLTANVQPTYASNQSVIWSSSEPNVVTVQGGLVTPVGSGKSIITVMTTDGNKTASCIVIVTPSKGETGQWDERQAEQSVAKDKTWRVKFSKAVDPESINRQNIMVLDSNNEPVKIDVKADVENDKIILVTPKDSYKAGERYRLYLGAGLDSSTGKSLSKGILFRFTVE